MIRLAARMALLGLDPFAVLDERDPRRRRVWMVIVELAEEIAAAREEGIAAMHANLTGQVFGGKPKARS